MYQLIKNNYNINNYYSIQSQLFFIQYIIYILENNNNFKNVQVLLRVGI